MEREKQEQIWERGKDALARILKHVSVDKVERLADKIEKKEFRESIMYKTFINSLK